MPPAPRARGQAAELGASLVTMTLYVACCCAEHGGVIIEKAESQVVTCT